MAKQMNLRLDEALLKEIEELSQHENLDRKFYYTEIHIKRSLKKSILNLMKDELIQENIQTSEIKKVYLTDAEDIAFSKNATTVVDVVIDDGKTILIEIKYRPNDNNKPCLNRTGQIDDLNDFYT